MASAVGRVDRRSPAEAELLLQLKVARLPEPIPNFQPCHSRRWRVDFAWPGAMVAVEVHGAVHRIRERHHADAEKELWLVAAGWRVLRVTPRQVRSGLALDAITHILGQSSPGEWLERLRKHGVIPS